MPMTREAAPSTGARQPESIMGSGYPLAFKFRQGTERPPLVAQENARGVFVTEARQLARFGKEGVIHEGANGSVWRLTTDEGKHFGADDVAPFPLGFFNAGLIGDLANRLLAIARVRGIAVDALEVDLDNPFWMQGSFVRGDAFSHADPATIDLRLNSPADAHTIRRLVDDAIKASPPMHGLRTQLKNTFAIYVNGRRRPVTSMDASTAPDAADPFQTYSTPPAPLANSDQFDDIITKTGKVHDGEVMRYPSGSKAKLVRHVIGNGRLIDPAGIMATECALDMPGVSFFRYKTDERSHIEQGPSGLALFSAAIAFCYMTQIARFIEHQKLSIRGVRIVQHTPYMLTGSIADGTWTGTQGPVDTHLFLSGDETDETHERLMTTGATICFLHSALRDANDPVVSIELNSNEI
ncbi:MAG: OsmC family protein [Alphaproteobacteria bacterium]